MSGTVTGGKLAAEMNKERHGQAFYSIIGAIGGASSNTGGFAAGAKGRERARKYGALGGRKSRKGATKPLQLTKAQVRQLRAKQLLKDLRSGKTDYHTYMLESQKLYDY